MAPTRWLAWLPGGVALVILLLLPRTSLLNNFGLAFLAGLAITVMLTASLNLCMGYAGLVSMAHTGLYATGAYSSGILVLKSGWPFWLSFPASIGIAAAIGALMALATLRASHLYFAMITFAFNLILVEIATEAEGLTGGLTGLQGIPRPRFGDYGLSLPDYYILVWIVVAAALLIIRNVIRSRYGRAFIALRDGEDGAAALGIPPFRYKLLNFSLSAALAGAAGALFAHLNGFMNPALGGGDASLNLFIGLLFGGIGTLVGPVLGMSLVIGIQQAIAPIAMYQALIFGALLLVAMMAVPAGLIGTWQRLTAGRHIGASRDVSAGLLEVGDPLAHLVARAQDRSAAIALEVRNLSKRFGGLQALRAIDLAVRAGSVHGLIGPNGSGKSTTVNCITGYYLPDGGDVFLDGVRVTRPRPHRLARQGLLRVFQAAHLFGRMTALENVMTGRYLESEQRLWDAVLRLPRFGRDERAIRAHAYGLLRLVGLESQAGRVAADLPYGQQRLLELARALAAEPKVLILDEPATGLTAEDLARLGGVIDRLRAAGLTVLLIEHNMSFVMQVCDRLTVLDHGEKLIDGTPDEVRRDPNVIEAYLGTARSVLQV